MSSKQVREIVVRLREELKPIKAYWHSGPAQPDWLFITRVTGHGDDELFELQSVKVWSAAGKPELANAGLTGHVSYETLLIAKGQAHADLGVEYVEWEPCEVEITNPDGSIDWSRALPGVEAGDCR